MSYSELGVKLFMSAHRALLGAIDRRMVGVTAGFRERVIIVRSYIEEDVTEEDVERIQVISTEIITDFVDDGYNVEEECLSIREHSMEVLDFWAFLLDKECLRADKKVR